MRALILILLSVASFAQTPAHILAQWYVDHPQHTPIGNVTIAGRPAFVKQVNTEMDDVVIKGKRFYVTLPTKPVPAGDVSALDVAKLILAGTPLDVIGKHERRAKPYERYTQGPEHDVVTIGKQVFHIFIGDGVSQVSGEAFDEFSVKEDQRVGNKGDWFSVKMAYTGEDKSKRNGVAE